MAAACCAKSAASTERRRNGRLHAVDTQMMRLRRKLGDFGQRIEAVWGLGCRFR